MTKSPLRPAGFDDLGVRRALSDRLLPSLVAAMTFLAALAMAGAVGASALAAHWQQGAGRVLTIQVPQPAEPGARGTRLQAVQTALTATPGLGDLHALDEAELRALLRPWLGAGLGGGLGSGGGGIAIPLPAVIEARLADAGLDRPKLEAALDAAAPGTLIEEPDQWVGRIAVLARSLQLCAGLALAVVGFVAVAVVAVATRAGLAARRDAIETVHGLGATDGYIASRFARRAMTLAGAGSIVGAAGALPVLLGLANLAAPFSGSPASTAMTSQSVVAALATMPATLWLALPGLPLLAAAIGWITAHGTVRRWLRRLP